MKVLKDIVIDNNTENDYRYFKYDDIKDISDYHVFVKIRTCSSKIITAGLWDFSNKQMMYLRNFDVSVTKTFNISFSTGWNSSDIAFLVYVGEFSKTRFNSIHIDEIQITERTNYQLIALNTGNIKNNEFPVISSRKTQLDYKKILSDEGVIIDFDKLTAKHILTNNRFKININGTIFETVIFCNKSLKNNRLYVALSSAFHCSYPTFNRATWEKFFDGVFMSVVDPSLDKNNFGPCYYFGSLENNYLDYLKEIVLHVAKIYNISNDNIVFIGDSNAGFAALYLCDSLHNSKSIALNPQLSIPDHFFQLEKIEPFSRKTSFEQRFNIDFNDINIKDRLYLSRIFRNCNSSFFIFSNTASHCDYVQTQYIQNTLNHGFSFGFHRINNVFLLIDNFQSSSPHFAVPNEVIVKYIIQHLFYNSYGLDICSMYVIFDLLKRYYILERNYKKINKA